MTGHDSMLDELPEGHDHDHDSDDLGCATPAETIAAVDDGAACAWWQMTTFIAVSGDDAVTFLDAIASQDIAGIDVGSGAYALFLTPKARIIAPTLAWRLADSVVLLEIDPELVEHLESHLRRYRLRSKVTIEPVEAGCISLVGARADDIAARVPIPEGATAPHASAGWLTSPAWGTRARTWIGDRASTHEVVAWLEEHGEAVMADPETLDAVRIDAGVPSLSDLLVDSMPAEVGGVDVGVSLTKGCYLGQEPVARLHWRGHANRVLKRVQLAAPIADDLGDEPGDDADVPELAVMLAADATPDAPGRPRGRVTSWARHADGRVVGLAVLRRELGPTDALVVVPSMTPLTVVGGREDDATDG